jgi:hypothetical protein
MICAGVAALLEKLNLKKLPSRRSSTSRCTEAGYMMVMVVKKRMSKKKRRNKNRNGLALVAVPSGLVSVALYGASCTDERSYRNDYLDGALLLIASRARTPIHWRMRCKPGLVLSQSKNNNVITAADGAVIVPDADQDPALVARCA